MHFAENEKSASTRRAYATDWRDFAAWCAARGATPLPAHSGIIAAYLSSLAQQGRKASTIARKAAAIGYRHKLAGLEPPTSAEGVRAALRGIRRSVGVARAVKAPATAAIVRRMLDGCGARLIDIRDRALLAFGLASAMRWSELCALRVEGSDRDAGRAPGAHPTQQGRSGRAGAGDRVPAWRQAAPGRGATGLARSG